MRQRKEKGRILFDLNHPADFHLFRKLIGELRHSGYGIRIIARNKDCLQELLLSDQIPFYSRGKGSHRIAGKYIFGLWNMVVIGWHLIRFRPMLTISLASPYLILASGMLGIQAITFIDTDINPRIFPYIKRATYIFTPDTFGHSFHRHHFLLHTIKELAYIDAKQGVNELPGEGMFFRITRTDSVHHGAGARINLHRIIGKINELSAGHSCILSSEIWPLRGLSESVRRGTVTRIHSELSQCRVLWGNSPTMASEAAMMGIPAIYVGTEKFSYITELEQAGLVFHFYPDRIEESWDKLAELVNQAYSTGDYIKSRSAFLKNKIDPTPFFSWFIENLPDSANLLEEQPEIQHRFAL